jgi:hypothetical protein
MKLNIHILFDELVEFSPQISTSKDIDLTLSQIRLPIFSDSDNLQQNYIYLLEASELEENIPLLHGLDLITIGYIDVQNDKLSDLSLIMLPNDCEKAVIFDRVQDIFEKYEQWDDDLMLNIVSNEPFQTVADEAAITLINPFVILDVALAIIVKGGKIPENNKGTIWELVLDKGYSPNEAFAFSPSDLYSFLEHDDRPYFGYPAPFEYNAHLVANINLDGKLFAMICTTDINAPLTQGQVSLFQHVRNIMELAFSSNINHKVSIESVHYYLDNLIKGLPVDERVLNYHLSKRGWKQNDRFCLYAITNLDGEELKDNQAKFCIYRIKKLNDDAIIFTYENFIISVTKQTKDNDMEYRAKLLKLLQKLGLQCGYSHIFDCFSDLRDYYIQGKAALSEGDKNNPKNTLLDFNDYYFQYVTRLLDNSTSIKSLCHPSVLRLLEYDKKHYTDFVRCLRTYLSNGCNVAKTGKSLFMHRNTLVYRLEKISEIIEMDVQHLCENERMQILFSCTMCHDINHLM